MFKDIMQHPKKTQTIKNVFHSGHNLSKLAVVEYVGHFPGLTLHGNSTKGEDDTRVPTHVMDEIADLTGKMKPHHIMNKLTDKYNIFPFVRSVFRGSGWSPTIILYTDEQIHDIKTICCTGKTVLGLDKTFMLCKMHVTISCYKKRTTEQVTIPFF